MPAAKAGESRVFQGPSRYIQGPGEINNLPKFAGSFGDTALAIIDTFFYKEYSEKFEKMFAEAGMTAYSYEFSGAATDAAIAKIVEFAKALPKQPQTVIGLGGGQTCDINKAVGATLGAHWISCPTALTTDAPTSTHTIINNPGEQNKLMFHYKNPDFVVVDTDITITAPAWMLVSGIGDALATYIEAEASFANNNIPNAGSGFGCYRPALTGMAIAKLSFDVLMEKGEAAMLAAKNHLRTPAYEDVVEATVLLSGLGFECTGVSIAHGLQAGFHVLPVKLLHGTGVGYCTLVQLIIENKTKMFDKVFDFCRRVGIPTCTEELGIKPEEREQCIEALVDDVYGKRWNVLNVPHPFTRETLVNAIKYLDAYSAAK